MNKLNITKTPEENNTQNSASLSGQMHYLNLLRIIGCILVVGVHVSAFNLEDLSFPSIQIFITNAFNHISLIGVPLFVMISGSILLNPAYELSYKKLLTRKIPRLILVYFVWLLFYNLLNCYQEGYGYSLSSIKHNVLLNSLLGYGIYHLWFLPMMIGLYFITPVLRKLSDDKKLLQYFLILYFIAAIFFPTILKFEFRFKTIVDSLYNRIPYSIFVGYIGYYILGHYIHSFVPKLKNKAKWITLITGILFCSLGFVVSYYRALGRGVFSQILNDPFTINDFIATACLFLFIKNTNSYFLSHKRLATIIKYLSTLTMGIYLIHPAFLMIANWFHLDTLFLPPLISIPVCTIIVTIISGVIIALLKLIPGIKNLLL